MRSGAGDRMRELFITLDFRYDRTFEIEDGGLDSISISESKSMNAEICLRTWEEWRWENTPR